MIKVIKERPIVDNDGQAALELQIEDTECSNAPCLHCYYRNWKNPRQNNVSCLTAHNCSFLDS